MRLTGQQRQKKRDKKEAKRLLMEAEGPPMEHPPAAREIRPFGDFVGCWAETGDGRAQGIISLWVARNRTSGGARLAIFLVDTYCLGVKDAVWVDDSLASLKRRIQAWQSQASVESLSPSMTRRILDDCVAYASDLGFQPHKMYARAAEFLQDVEPDAGTPPISLGRNGKPTFISHPDDSPARCRDIVQTLIRSRGPDGFRYVLLEHQTRGLLGSARD